jgi:hypothetical protein
MCAAISVFLRLGLLIETNGLDCFCNGREAQIIYAELRLSRLARLTTFLLPSSKDRPLDLVQCCDLRTF